MAETAQPIILTFGGGLNTRVRVTDVAAVEATAGKNFDIDPDFAALRKRRGFDRLGSPIAFSPRRINGFVQLVRANGTISTLVQASGNILEWDLADGFTLVGTVSPNARLRGHRQHNFPLADTVIVTDLALQEPVKKWDGSTFGNLDHNLTGDFRAKYCRVVGERAYYANINTTTMTPQVILGSAVSDFENLSERDKPSSALGDDAAFFLVTPDLRPVNGIEQGFGRIVFSTEKGQLYELTGSSAQDFNITEFYFGSAVSGDEAIVNVGNDILMGLPGRIETLSGVLNFGDVEADDISRFIAPSIRKVSRWNTLYDRTNQNVLCIPDNSDRIYVLKKTAATQNPQISPWVFWQTSEALGLGAPTAVQTILGPDGTDWIVAGYADGTILRLNGEGSLDNGVANVLLSRTSGIIRGPLPQVMDITGWVNYRKKFAARLVLTFLFGGVHELDQQIVINLPETTERVPVYGGPAYYNDGRSFYSEGFSTRISREEFAPAGQSNHFQVQVDHIGAEDIQIEEIGLIYRTANPTALHNP